MLKINIQKSEVKETAIEFMESLQNWCSREHVVEAFKQQGRALDEKDIDLAIHHSRQLVEPVINAFQPIYLLAINGKINQPFSFISYMMSKTGRVLGDELSDNEIRLPYLRLAELLMSGLDPDSFYASEYYKDNILPDGFK